MAVENWTGLEMTTVSRGSLYRRSHTRLTLGALLLSFATIASSQTVVMEISSGGCGSPANSSVTDYTWRYKWQKDRLLVVSGALPESGSTRVKRGSARITPRGNLLVIAYENYELEQEFDEKGRAILAPVCAWRIPVTFSIRGLADDHYYLIVGRESGESFRVMTSVVVDEPRE